MKKLQEEFPDYEFFTIEGCLNELGWEYEKEGDNYKDIKCSCGTTVKFGGWIGTEHAWCPECGKGMQSFTGLLPASNVTAGAIDIKEYDISDKKVWVPKNLWGLK